MFVINGNNNNNNNKNYDIIENLKKKNHKSASRIVLKTNRKNCQYFLPELTTNKKSY